MKMPVKENIPAGTTCFQKLEEEDIFGGSDQDKRTMGTMGLNKIILAILEQFKHYNIKQLNIETSHGEIDFIYFCIEGADLREEEIEVDFDLEENKFYANDELSKKYVTFFNELLEKVKSENHAIQADGDEEE